MTENSRAGTRWTEDEISQLIDKFKKNIDLLDISKEHKRTIASIKLKIFQQAIKIMELENLDFDEISKKLNINKAEFEAYKIKLDAENELKQKKDNKDEIIAEMQKDIIELKRKMKEFIIIIKETRNILENL